MKQVICECRAAHAKSRAEMEQRESRYKIEGAVRRKHNLKDSHRFNDDDWKRPLSVIAARMTHLVSKERQRRAERRARGKQLRPLPPRSSLSHSELAAEVTRDDDAVAKLRAAEEEQERVRWERQVWQVSREVGYLCFVGTTEDWRQDVVRSKEGLIWRAEKGEETTDKNQTGTDAE
jgi:hypothetical protein